MQISATGERKKEGNPSSYCSNDEQAEASRAWALQLMKKQSKSWLRALSTISAGGVVVDSRRGVLAASGTTEQKIRRGS